MILTRKFEYACELEEEEKIKWKGQSNLTQFFSKSWRLKHWLGLNCLSLAIKYPSVLDGSKRTFKIREGCTLLNMSSGLAMYQVPFSPSPKAERRKTGAYCTRVVQSWSLTIAATLKECNNITVNSIDVLPVVVFSIIAVLCNTSVILDMSLYMGIHLFNIWNAYFTENILF